MRVLSLLTVAVTLGLPLALAKHVVVEQRESHPHSWKRSTSDLDPDSTMFTLHVGLQQQNLHALEDILFKVSDPSSDTYGQHWTPLQVKEFFQPSKESLDTVRDWLRSAGHHEHTIAPSAGWISVEMTVAEAESLLDTTYRRVEHSTLDHQSIACDSYSVPEHVRAHIELIKPTLHYDQPTVLRHVSEHKGQKGFKRYAQKNSHNKRGMHMHQKKNIRPTAAIRQGASIVSDRLSPQSAAMQSQAVHAPADQLAGCVNATTILCLQTLYGMGSYTPTGTGLSAFGIVEYPPQSYIGADLDRYYASYTQLPAGLRPTFIGVDGAYLDPVYESFANNGESNLDLTYAIGLAYPLNVALYEAGPPDNGGSFNNLLDAIDGSYCLYLGGQDPNYDGVYTPRACGNATRPDVLSTSYAYNEGDLTPAYMDRQCKEYAKLGALGTTVLYATGDYGVGGSGGICYTAGTNNYATNATATGQRFNPAFPASCPYVTGVGATQIAVGKLASDPNPEIACTNRITSGGGFSTFFGLPSWQRDSMANYYSKYAPPYPASQYNNSQQARGFPDISANGANFITSLNGTFYKLYGTSASTPVIGAMIALINDNRRAHGKGTVGFINPALYSARFKSALNDITSGNNAGCGTQGFSAVPGWDPVTGLGTPNFPQLMNLFMAK